MARPPYITPEQAHHLFGGEVPKPRQRRDDPEHRIQAELIARARLLEAQHPELADLHAIPNGGKRGKATAARMKAEGVKRGVPDLFLSVPVWGRPINTWPSPSTGDWHGLYLETKAPGGSLTPEQRGFMQRAASHGYACATYRSADEGVTLLMRYLSGEWEQLEGMIR